MRAFILAAGATLAISACNNGDSAGNTVNVGDNVAAEDIVANDTTAIDAATNEAANMAEDSEITLEPIGNDSSNEPDRPARRTAPRPDREPAATASEDASVANSATNAQ